MDGPCLLYLNQKKEGWQALEIIIIIKFFTQKLLRVITRKTED